MLTSSSSFHCTLLLSQRESSSITKHHADYVPVLIIHSHLILHRVKNVAASVPSNVSIPQINGCRVDVSCLPVYSCWIFTFSTKRRD